MVTSVSSSRGLGLQFCRHYVAAGWFVIATLRKLGSSPALDELKREVGDKMFIIEMDTSNEVSIGTCAERLISGIGFPAEIGEKRIDLVINSAGFYGTKAPIGEITAADMMDVFQTNSLGPLLVTQALLPLLRKSSVGAKIVMVTSELASIGTNRSGGRYPYRTSKAALNAVTKSMAVDLGKENIMAFEWLPQSTTTRLHPTAQTAPRQLCCLATAWAWSFESCLWLLLFCIALSTVCILAGYRRTWEARKPTSRSR